MLIVHRLCLGSRTGPASMELERILVSPATSALGSMTGAPLIYVEDPISDLR